MATYSFLLLSFLAKMFFVGSWLTTTLDDYDPGGTTCDDELLAFIAACSRLPSTAIMLEFTSELEA